MNTKKKNYTLLVLIVLLLALAVGYAAFSSTLTINGTVTGTGTWNVHFKQNGRFLQADGTTVDSTHSGSATISQGQGSNVNNVMTVSVNLAYPGDGVLLEAIVENTGTMDAKLTGFTINTNNDTDLIVTQAAGGPTVNEVLSANGGTCTATFLIKWNENSTVTSLGTKTFTITYEYDQNTTTVFNGTPTHADA